VELLHIISSAQEKAALGSLQPGESGRIAAIAKLIDKNRASVIFPDHRHGLRFGSNIATKLWPQQRTLTKA